MITLQHSLLYFLGVVEKFERKDWDEELRFGIPWVLLPDAIRMCGERQTGHFEKSFDNRDVSWMRYPDDLKEINGDNVDQMIEYHRVKGIRECAIGEETDIETFDLHNWDHTHFRYIRMHLLQDQVMDKTLRRIIDCSGCYQDEFVVEHNRSKKLDGEELRVQIARLEELVFIMLAGIVYKKTGIVTDQYWFDTKIKTALEDCYSKDMAENTYKHMIVPCRIDARIVPHCFIITTEDWLYKVNIVEDLEDILNEICSKAYINTLREL